LIFFAGSTIGNFTRDDALALLTRLGHLVPRAALLVGVDLKKPRPVLEAAYNDAEGVTAAFNKNLLRRLNAELGADFELTQFAHRAHYDEWRGRVEMHLVSRVDQAVSVGGETITFKAGETIHTENSHKYAVSEFQELAEGVGLTPAASWVDEAQRFSLHYLEPAAPALR
jgi:dimethylhistidine N-methyltransferase